MLKKILCTVIIVMVIITATTAFPAGAAEIGPANTNTQKATIMGDVDLDGVISILDATEIQRALADVITLSDEQLKAAKVTGFDEMYIGDATEIQRYLAGYRCYSLIGDKITDEEDNDNQFVYDVEYIENAIAEKFMEYVNAERKAVGVQHLYVNEELMKATEIRDDEIVVSFSHTRPDGTACYTAIDNINIFGWRGENIAMHGGHCEFNDPETIEHEIEFTAWKFYDQFKKSTQGHYENMIKEEYNCHGVGVKIIIGEYNMVECYVAHMFGQTTN